MDNNETQNKKIKKTEDMKEYRRLYRQENKDKIKEYYKNWLEKNNGNNNHIKCECGVETVKSSISKHRQTKKHKEQEKKDLVNLLKLEEETEEEKNERLLNFEEEKYERWQR
jgi:hypothetical protein